LTLGSPTLTTALLEATSEAVSPQWPIPYQPVGHARDRLRTRVRQRASTEPFLSTIVFSN